jgi:xylulokinase
VKRAGAAVMAGVGAGVFPSYESGVAAMVHLERRFEPDAQQHRLYDAWFERYRPLWPLMREYLRRLAAPVG